MFRITFLRVLFLALVSVVFVAGCQWFSGEKSDAPSQGSRLDVLEEDHEVVQDETDEEVSDSEEISDEPVVEVVPPKDDNQILRDALNQGSMELCKTILGEDLLSFCLNSIAFEEAVKNDDREACITLANAELQTKCNDKISQKEASVSGDVTKCATILDVHERQNCESVIYLKTAVSQGNESQCSQITNEALRRKCLESSLRQSDNEVKTQAISQSSPELCTSIQNVKEKESCFDQVHLKIALRDKKPDLCEQIFTAHIRDNCLRTVVPSLAVKQMDVKLCDKLSADAAREQCYTSVRMVIDKEILKKVRENKDTSLCITIRDERLKAACETF